MKKRNLLLLLFCFFSSSVLAIQRDDDLKGYVDYMAEYTKSVIMYGNYSNRIYGTSRDQTSECIRRCQKIMEFVKDNHYSNDQYPKLLEDMADYYYCIGEPDSCIKYQSQASRLYYENSGGNPRYMARPYLRLADYSKHFGFYGQAEVIYKDLIKSLTRSNIDEKIFSYWGLALCQWQEDRKNEAVNNCRMALKLSRNYQLFSYSYVNINYALKYVEMEIDMASFDFQMGDKESFLSDLDEAMKSNAKDGNVITSIKLAELLCKAEKWDTAKDLAIDICSKSKLIVNASFGRLSGAERLECWNQKFRRWFEVVFPQIALHVRDAQMIGLLYDNALFSKSLLLNADFDIRRKILASKDENLRKNYSDLLDVEEKMNMMLWRGKTDLVDSCQNRIVELEALVMESFQKNSEKEVVRVATWKNIQKKLGANDVAVEFLFVPNGNVGHYYAVVLKKNTNVPALVDLCEDSAIEKLSETQIYSTKQLYSLVWKPLEKYLYKATNVYFSPTGKLYNMAIEYVPGTDNPVCRMHRMTSTRNISKSKLSKFKSMMLWGGIDYDKSKYIALKDASDSIYNFDNNGERGLVGRKKMVDRNLVDGVEQLPNSLGEVDNIQRMAKQQDLKCGVVRGSFATETLFKEMWRYGGDILHISTHGFFIPQNETDSMQLSFLNNADDNVFRRHLFEDKVLIRTGLLLAGANNTLRQNGCCDKDKLDDGILTAKEISQMDLSNWDLLTLSACQTGLGSVSSEGVWGLQRAFKKAGAKSIIMSLWDVDDEATRILMTEFYRALFAGGTKHDALKQAQECLRKYDGGIYSSPYYWAAFVLLDA